MLLNNFLYLRSLKKNERIKNINNFQSLIPKSTFHSIFHNPYDKEEYFEEIKNVSIKKGGNNAILEDSDDDEDLKDLEDNISIDSNEEENSSESSESDDNLEYHSISSSDNEDDGNGEDDENGEDDGNGEEDENGENDEDEDEDEDEEVKEEDDIIGEKDYEVVENVVDTEVIEQNTPIKNIPTKKDFGGKEVIFDNITEKTGGENKDVKNITVTFF
jgi:hypothetical protein